MVDQKIWESILRVANYDEEKANKMWRLANSFRPRSEPKSQLEANIRRLALAQHGNEQ